MKTIEIWKGEFYAEVGNFSFLGEIRKEGYTGVVIALIIGPSLVEILWKPNKKRRKKARLENENHNAVTRILHAERLPS